MIKKIRREFKRHFKLVKKFSSRIEAELAKEILEAYHINAYDYPRAAQVLNLAR